MKNFLNRSDIVEHLESVYKGQYGEYKYYAGQSFVFKEDKKVNKTLLIRPFKKLADRPSGKNLVIKTREVYEGDSVKDLNKVIDGLKEETNWYVSEFGHISNLDMPKEEYSICKDPMETDNDTVLISTQWIKNIEGDIFRIDAEKLYGYINEYPEFKNTLIQLITKFIELSEEDIYPDYIGTDNVAIYLDKGIPKIALLDRHIISIRKFCDYDTQEKMDRAVNRLKKFIEDPLNIENIRYLTKSGLVM